ncbi:hypothetical protein HK098_002000 [Nowakowskiella sp. JEL0407]|nr:hypothetical protein HK098_002000 [Nowakowskiella sp. JEL0407]
MASYNQSSPFVAHAPQAMAQYPPQPQQQQPQYFQVPVQQTDGYSPGQNMRPYPQEKRATHNATERARREMLNIKFQELANSIPALLNVRKPSKSVIVQKSLEHVEEMHRLNERKDNAIRILSERNSNLRVEVGKLRALLGQPPLSPENDQDILSALSSTPFHPQQQPSRIGSFTPRPPPMVVYTTNTLGIPNSTMSPNSLNTATTLSATIAGMDQNVNTISTEIQPLQYNLMNSNRMQSEGDSGNESGDLGPSTTGAEDSEFSKPVYEDSLFNTLLQGDIAQNSNENFAFDTTFTSSESSATNSSQAHLISVTSGVDISGQLQHITISTQPQQDMNVMNGQNLSHSPADVKEDGPSPVSGSQSNSIFSNEHHSLVTSQNSLQQPTPIPISMPMPHHQLQQPQMKVIQYSSTAPAQLFSPLTPPTNTPNQYHPHQQPPQYLYNNSIPMQTATAVNTPPPEPMYTVHQMQHAQPQMQIQTVPPQVQAQFPPGTIFVNPGIPTNAVVQGGPDNMMYRRTLSYAEAPTMQYGNGTFVQQQPTMIQQPMQQIQNVQQFQTQQMMQPQTQFQ